MDLKRPRAESVTELKISASLGSGLEPEGCCVLLLIFASCLELVVFVKLVDVVCCALQSEK